MYGAIIGDIIGSRFEFDRGDKSRDFELFTTECNFTDDTVMTVAVAEALLEAGKDADEKTIKSYLIKSMKKWGQKYPDAGYGARFISWVLTEEPEPYGSYGNGSGMRVSPVGWLYDTIERTKEVAKWTSEVTHNHPEGIKGAESTAAAIFMARNGATKDEIKKYLVEEFGYNLTRTLDEISPSYYHVEDCMRTMPETFTCFLEANNYEETIRNVMYIGGDTDTLGAIAGAIAEAMWGVPLSIIADAKEFVPEDIAEVVDRFHSIVFKSDNDHEDTFADNKFIKMAAERCYYERNKENLLILLNVLRKRMDDEGEVLMPMIDVNGAMSQLTADDLCLGKEYQITEEVRLRMDTVIDEEGNQWFPLFTDEEELNRKDTTNIRINTPIEQILRNGVTSDRVLGVVINPFGHMLTIPKEILKIVLKEDKDNE